jgi:hypothetical protein
MARDVVAPHGSWRSAECRASVSNYTVMGESPKMSATMLDQSSSCWTDELIIRLVEQGCSHSDGVRW